MLETRARQFVSSLSTSSSFDEGQELLRRALEVVTGLRGDDMEKAHDHAMATELWNELCDSSTTPPQPSISINPHPEQRHTAAARLDRQEAYPLEQIMD